MKNIIAIVLLSLACSSVHAENNNNWPPKKPKNWNDKEQRVIKAQKELDSIKAKLDKANVGTRLLGDVLAEEGIYPQDN